MPGIFWCAGTFEAAATHLSFTRAAHELFVTQAAVSHQIKALEERLGVKLFNRLGRALTLTEPAQRFLPAVRESFDRLSAATDELLQANTAGALNVTTLNSFAALWLVPRLARFQARHPDIAVRIHAADEVVDLRRQGYDIAIRYGAGKWPDLHAEKLFDDDTYPVCSPALLAGPHPLRVAEDLRHFTLLHEEMIDITWVHWLRAAGVADIDPARGPVFSHANMVIQAAINGQGVALGRGPLIADELAAGGTAVRVVSMPCQEIFDRQDEAYRQSVLPPHVRGRVSVEAAVSMGWQRYVGPDGAVIACDKFGTSAPGGEAMIEYGFTVDAVVAASRTVLSRTTG